VTNRPQVLIIEDDPDALDVMRGVVKRAGFAPVTCTNAEEALLKIDTGLLPAVIVIDIRLRGIDGLEFMRRLHAKHEAGTLANIPPACAITAFHTTQLVAQALNLGFAHCLRKPIDVDLVTQTIQQLHQLP